jgi:hypothetical protein
VVTPPTCARLAPTVTLSPGAPAAVAAGTTLSYATTIVNNDSTSCAATTFTLSPTAPAGWAAAVIASSVSLSPGASASVTLQVTSASTAAPTIYSTGVATSSQADAAHAAAGLASYTVRAPLVPSVATDKASYIRSETVTTTARVMAGAVPVSGVSVTIQVRKADGKIVTSTATSDGNGYTTHRLRLARKDPLGTYESTASGTGVAAAVASFIVR